MKFRTTLIVLFMSLTAALQVPADTNELAELKEEFEREEYLRKIAEQRRLRLAAELPASDTKGKEGAITAEDLKIEVQILSHYALSNLAVNMALEIKGEAGEASVVFCSSNDFTALRHAESLRQQLRFVRTELEAVRGSVARVNTGAEIGLAIMAAQGIIKGIADIVALFKSDMALKGVAVTLEEDALAALLVRSHDKISYPKLYSPTDLAGTAVYGEVERIIELRRAILEEINQPVQNNRRGNGRGEGDARPEPGDAPADARRLAEPGAAPKNASPAENEPAAITRARKLIAGVDELLATLHAPVANGSSLLMEAARAEKIKSQWLLYARVNAAGGNNLTKKNLWRNPRLYHSGGAILTYILYRPDGAIATSGVISGYSGYVKQSTGSRGALPLLPPPASPNKDKK